ncbi:MAG TPA: transposase [Afifellaceae bacterium]|nr:transposase [Afifellaceae bacterium]
MALGRQGERQSELMVGWAELPRSPGHAFYDRLQAVLIEAGFDGFAESQCARYYASRRGRPSLPPGRYFRMHLVGYFEGIDSERGLEWRCADSLSLREFLRLGLTDPVPDHSWLSKTRSRLPLEVHEAVFGWVLQRLAEHDLIKGDRLGVDASTIEANAALRAIVGRDSGEGYREMLKRLAMESGIATPTAEDLIRLDRQRKGKRLSNQDWTSPVDPEARIAKLKDGRTRLAYKPEHAVDLDTGAIVAAAIHAADQGDTATLPETLEAAEANLALVDAGPTPEEPAELVADKGYHSRDGLKDLEDGPWKSRIAEKKRPDVSRWHGDQEARRAVYNNRARLRSGVAREAFKLRAELVERSFALVLDRGGMRRAWLRGRANLQKRYLVHVAGYNLGLIMRRLVGAGTPRELLAGASAYLLALATADGTVFVILIAATDSEATMLALSLKPEPRG